MLIRSRWWRRILPRIPALFVVFAVALGAIIVPRIGTTDLVVLCSNNVAACEAVVDAYENETGSSVTVVRMPTSQALTRVRVPKEAGEFDVWMGGPAEAYTLAATEGHLASVTIDNDIPEELKDPDGRWYGIYGGILAFCVADDVAAPQTWDDLVSDPSYRVVVPNPVSSGTAFTMLSVQMNRLGSEEAMVDYMLQLDNVVSTYTDSGTVPAHLVGSGRADIAVTFGPYCETERILGSSVTTVYPADGTGFEVGAIGVLEESSRAEEAVAFLEYVVSGDGQIIGAQVENQLPVSTEFAVNLLGRLEDLEVEIFGWDFETTGAMRSRLIDVWLRDVRDGSY